MTKEERLIAWLEHRLDYADRGTYPIYVKQFQKAWIDEFGSLSSVPEQYRDKVDKRYKKLKEATK